MMTPGIKKIASTLLFAALGAVLVALGNFVPQLPQAVQALAVAALASAAHYVNAWGHTQRVDAVASASFRAGQRSAPPLSAAPPAA